MMLVRRTQWVEVQAIQALWIESSSTMRFIAVVIATATSRDGDDSFFLFFFFSSDASNVLVQMRARDVERREEEGWTVLGCRILFISH